MVTDVSDYTGETDEVTEQNRRWQNMPLSDYQYVAGDGTPFCLDNNVLMYAPWRLSNVQYDRSLSFGGKKRYRPLLTFFVKVPQPRAFIRPKVTKVDGKEVPDWATDSDGNFRLGKGGQPVAKAQDVVHLGWTYELLPIGSSSVKAEDSKVYEKIQREWNSGQFFDEKKRRRGKYTRKELRVV